MNRPHERKFPRSAAAVGRAREFVAAYLLGWSSAEQATDIHLCASELATNAVRHGSPRGHEFLVRISAYDGVLRLEIHDAGEGHPRVCAPADTDAAGRGLVLVDALADDWGVGGRDGVGKMVWAEFKVRAAAEAPC